MPDLVKPEITVEQLKAQVRNRGIERWDSHRCHLCQYMCGYIFPGNDLVFYDNGCLCVGIAPLSPRTWENVKRRYDIQTNQDVVDSMVTFWLGQPCGHGRREFTPCFDCNRDRHLKEMEGRWRDAQEVPYEHLSKFVAIGHDGDELIDKRHLAQRIFNDWMPHKETVKLKDVVYSYVVWDCDVRKPELSADEVAEIMLQDLGDDARDLLTPAHVIILQGLLDKWTAGLPESLTVYRPNFDRKMSREAKYDVLESIRSDM